MKARKKTGKRLARYALFTRHIVGARRALPLLAILLVSCRPLLSPPSGSPDSDKPAMDSPATTAPETEPETAPETEPETAPEKKEVREPPLVGTVENNYLTFKFTTPAAIDSSIESRSITGATDAQITRGNGLRNIYQIISIDNADPDGTIWDFDQAGNGAAGGEISLKMQVRTQHTYHILILGGYAANPDAFPVEPVLLTAGYIKATINDSAGSIMVPMYSMVADIKFKGVDEDDPTTVISKEPVLGMQTLLSAKYHWTAVWSLSGYYGDPLLPLKTSEAAAPNRADGTYITVNSGSALSFTYEPSSGKSPKTISVGPTMDGSDMNIPLSYSNNAWFDIGESGIVTFDISYSPFGYGPNDDNFRKYYADNEGFVHSETHQLNAAGKMPVWHIRNGLNGAKQDSNTDFSNITNAAKNGNGGVPLLITNPVTDGVQGGVYALSKQEGGSYRPLITSNEFTAGTEPLVGWFYNATSREFFAADGSATWGGHRPGTIDDVLSSALAWCNDSGNQSKASNGCFTIVLDGQIGPEKQTSAFTPGGSIAETILPGADYKLSSEASLTAALNVGLIALNDAASVEAVITKTGGNVLSVGGGSSASTLSLGGGIRVLGDSAAGTAVKVGAKGKLVLESGSSVTGSGGGGISVSGTGESAAGLVSIEGGTVSYNKGSGLIIGNYGQVNLTSGSISKNYSASKGGGVRVDGSAAKTYLFISGGTIEGNETVSGQGGGVWTAQTGAFVYMTGGLIEAAAAASGGSLSGYIQFTSSDGTSDPKTGLVGTDEYPDAINHPGQRWFKGTTPEQIRVDDAVQPGKAGIYKGHYIPDTTTLPEVSWEADTSQGAPANQYKYKGNWSVGGQGLTGNTCDKSLLLANAFKICKALENDSVIKGKISEGLTIVFDCAVTGSAISFDGASYPKPIYITGKDSARTVGLSGATGNLFDIKGGTLNIDKNITLTGSASNNTALIGLSGGSLYLNTGAAIENNTNGASGGKGGALYISGTGVFHPPGRSISGCKASGSNGAGGAIYIDGSATTGGQAILSSGTIGGTSAALANSATNGGAIYVGANNNNTATKYALDIQNVKIQGNKAAQGGGIYVGGNGTVNISAGASIGGSAAGKNTATGAGGGGVYLSSSAGLFQMTELSAVISYNDASGTASNTGNGGGLYIAGGSHILSAGTISDNTCEGPNGGGGIYIPGGSLTLTGSSTSQLISGNKANHASEGYGGGISVKGGTLNLQGPDLHDNSAYKGGGAALISGNVAESAGSIYKNSATNTGGGVYVAGGTWTMKYAASSTAKIAGFLTGGSTLDGSLAANTATSKPETAALDGSIGFANDNWGIVGGEELMQALPQSTASGKYSITVTDKNPNIAQNTFYIFYGSDSTGTYSSDYNPVNLIVPHSKAMISVGSTVSLSEVITTALSKAGSANTVIIGIPNMFNNVQGGTESITSPLTASLDKADFTLKASSAVTIPSGKTVVFMPLCNGSTDTAKQKEPAVIQLYSTTGNLINLSGGNLILGSSANANGTSLVFRGPATATALSNNNLPLVSIAGGTMTTYSGITIAGNCSTTGPAGLSISAGTFNLSGGTITSNANTSPTGADSTYGAGVYVAGSGIFNLTSGEVSNNSSTQKSIAGIYVTTGGKLNMSGGSITGNTTVLHAGGIAVNGTGKFTMTGGSIDNNNGTSASSMGGGLYIATSGTSITSPDVNISGGSISNNTGGSGGGIGINSGTVVLSSVKINENIGTDGGGVRLVAGTLAIKTGTEIAGNTIKSGGGGFAGGLSLSGGKATITGASIHGNIAAAGGGGMRIHGSTVTITDSQIYGNTANTAGQSATSHPEYGYYGGGILVDSSGSLSITGSTLIYGNKVNAGFKGGGIAVNGGTATMSGGLIVGSSAYTDTAGTYGAAGTQYAANTGENAALYGTISASGSGNYIALDGTPYGASTGSTGSRITITRTVPPPPLPTVTGDVKSSIYYVKNGSRYDMVIKLDAKQEAKAAGVSAKLWGYTLTIPSAYNGKTAYLLLVGGGGSAYYEDYEDTPLANGGNGGAKFTMKTFNLNTANPATGSVGGGGMNAGAYSGPTYIYQSMAGGTTSFTMGSYSYTSAGGQKAPATNNQPDGGGGSGGGIVGTEWTVSPGVQYTITGEPRYFFGGGGGVICQVENSSTQSGISESYLEEGGTGCGGTANKPGAGNPAGWAGCVVLRIKDVGTPPSGSTSKTQQGTFN